MIHRFAGVAIALVAFVATSLFLHALLPPPVPEGIAAKLEFFAQHKDEFDTLVVGTSRVYYSVSPEIFDKTTRENGLPTRTFNFGIRWNASAGKFLRARTDPENQTAKFEVGLARNGRRPDEVAQDSRHATRGLLA